MSFVETPLQTSYPDEFSDKVAKVTASILQEQLAPIVETLRGLLDLHSALLNDGTAMNRYNAGKTDDVREFQNNVSFDLQFHADPEDRLYPNHRNPRTTPSTSTSTERLLNHASRLPAADARAQPTSSSSSVAATNGSSDRPSTPTATAEHADSRPTTPRQQLGGGFSVVPGHSRRLQRERPFSIAPDPMWNSSREIRPYESFAAAHAPPPPYVPPPTYAEMVVPPGPGQIESLVQVLRSPARPSAAEVEVIDIEPSTLQSSTLEVRDDSVSSDRIPRVLVTEEEANNDPSYSFGPSWTFARDGPSHLSTFLLAEEADDSTTPEAEMVDVVVGGDGNPNDESQLSEKARGKKRARDDDPSDDRDDTETLEILFGYSEGSSSGGNSSDRDGQPDRKRVKTDAETDDEGIDTDQSVANEWLSMIARLRFIRKSGWSQAKRLKETKKLHRRALLLA